MSHLAFLAIDLGHGSGFAFAKLSAEEGLQVFIVYILGAVTGGSLFARLRSGLGLASGRPAGQGEYLGVKIRITSCSRALRRLQE